MGLRQKKVIQTKGEQELSREHAAAHYSAKRRKRARIKGIKVFLIVLAAVVLAGGGAALAYFGNIESRLHDGLGSDMGDSLKATQDADDPFYMLLLGVDKSQERSESAEYGQSDSNYRTDSIMLARIDPKEKQVTLVSIHRDTQVDFADYDHPEYGVQKINAAYSFGGPAYTVDVISKFAGVPISHYAEIDFDHFVSIVDDLGGVEVDVPMDIDDPMAGEPIKAGPQTLNGAQALTLCRSRHAYDAYGDGDLYRAANQRMVIAAIAKKVLASDPTTMTSAISRMADAVTTDLSLNQILSLAGQMRGINMDSDVYSGMEPTTSSYENETWYEKVNAEGWKKMMERVDQGLSPYESAEDDPTGDKAGGSTNVKNADGSTTFDTSAKDDEKAVEDTADYTGQVTVLNGARISGLAAKAAEKLDGAGYTTSTGTAKNPYATTLVLYLNPESKAKAEGVAKTLGHGLEAKDGSTDYAGIATGDVLVIMGSDLADFS